MGYMAPVDAKVSSTWQGHKNRPTPSKEPGTDYACAYGTPIRVAYDGIVTHVDNSNGGAEGRRVTVKLTDGRVVSYIHLSRITVKVGAKVKRGQFIAYSGASGFGKDWFYGAHVHTSLWPRSGLRYADTIDFEKYVGDEPAPTVVKKHKRRKNMGYAVIHTNVKPDNKRRGAVIDNERGKISTFGDFPVSYANSVAVGFGLEASGPVTDGHFDKLMRDFT